ncbi:uncharacterized protein MONBRDRAFT_29660 [Monosiga brevicollis MX1]|uniref:DNA polymerase delta subunit 2 n=1 Tax=Monosiga brevicollis TaxID=81824 RepID=A9VBR8_MONBE|nr:uncharacterized protein MONBRDRAFT_29660 [Monosiga brevicollis MX1]EDQ85024.1 predicted protein [Monosiga brevicollis MX1]|eukprot:XP_001750194.1 hypothetical protein [Monosiga brevicollis MX1]
MAEALMSLPEPSEVDGTMTPDLAQRASATYESHADRFRLPAHRNYDKQYSNLYFSRYMTLRKSVIARAKSKWQLDQPGAPPLADNILGLAAMRGKPCVVVGTVYKDMKLKPNILDEFNARENYEAPPPERSKYFADDDVIILEDQTGRTVLSGAGLPVGELVSGVVMAAKGVENDKGEFEVNECCFCDMGPQAARQVPTQQRYLCLASGFNIDAQAKNLFALELFVDLITGQLGSPEQQQQMARVARVLLAGNLIRATTGEQDEVAQYKRRNMEPETVVHVKELDFILTQLCSTVPVDMMPGDHDPANKIVPQQPLHKCMFPTATKYGSLRGVTNPTDFVLDGVHILGTSGQNIDDVYRFTESEDRLELLERILRWGHLFPTAPDTLCVYPYTTEHKDPFAIGDCPHVFFAGNQPEFATKECSGPDGQKVRLVCVPDFSKTATAVLLDLHTLEATPLCFSNMVAETAPQAMDQAAERMAEAEAEAAWLVLAVDVGTTSVRTALVDPTGHILDRAVQEVQVHQPGPELAMQSSAEIWRACCSTTQALLQRTATSPDQVRAIAFDATCSMVVEAGDVTQGPRLSVDPTNTFAAAEIGDVPDVLMWMDHRASEEAQAINSTKHKVLRFVGGGVSLEMQMPKLCWLQTHLPDVYSQATGFFDLPDWLSFRATDNGARSRCSVICKWNYVDGCPGHDGWHTGYLNDIGLKDLAQSQQRIGTDVREPGSAVGTLTARAARELGLTTNCVVASSLIDAHAGMMGCLAASLLPNQPITERLCLIAGTSACHLALHPDLAFVPGVWGPYHGVVLPDYWLVEGGQSAAGAALDRVLALHAGADHWHKQAAREGRHVTEIMNEALQRLQQSEKASHLYELIADIHVVPDFHGNRSPLADPKLKGVIVGLSLTSELATECLLLYLATLTGLALGTRQILEAMRDNGYIIREICVCGGLSQNKLYLQLHADATGCRVRLPREADAVLVGTAVMGAVAAGGIRARHYNCDQVP